MMDLKIVTNPNGSITVGLPSGDSIRIRLGLTELADADEHLGKSTMQSLATDPTNFHVIRVTIYFGAREQNKGIRSIRQVSKLLEGIELKDLADLVSAALKAGGVLKNDDEEEGEPNDQGEA